LALFCQFASARSLREVLQGVEQRYNRVRTLRLEFEQTYTSQGRTRSESGSLCLRKPGRMRWDYAQPAGKTFVSDGDWLWFYSPFSNRVEKTRLKQSEDLRAPLAFLLGKLDFQRDFADFELHQEGEDSIVRAQPKSDRAPFTQVEFRVGPDNTIRALTIRGADGSRQRFVFRNEQPGVPVSEAAFRYLPPRGVEVVEVSAFGEDDQ
jgi:outer membrane lipoprotein carrier protein